MRAFRSRWAAYPPGTGLRSEWRLMLAREPWWLEMVGCAWAALAWGLWNTVNGAALVSRVTFEAVAVIAPDWAWQWAAMTLGLTQIACLIINNRTGRRVASGFGVWYWLALLALIVSMDPLAPGLPLYALPIAANLLSMILLRPRVG